MLSHVVLFICTETIHSSNLLLLFQPARPLPQTIKFSVCLCVSVRGALITSILKNPSSTPVPHPKTSSTTSQKLSNPSTPHNTPHSSNSFKTLVKKTRQHPVQTTSDTIFRISSSVGTWAPCECDVMRKIHPDSHISWASLVFPLMCRSNPVLVSTEGEVILEQKAFKKAS